LDSIIGDVWKAKPRYVCKLGLGHYRGGIEGIADRMLTVRRCNEKEVRSDITTKKVKE